MLKTSGIVAGKFYREAQWFILGDNRMNTKYYQEAAGKEGQTAISRDRRYMRPSR